MVHHKPSICRGTPQSLQERTYNLWGSKHGTAMVDEDGHASSIKWESFEFIQIPMKMNDHGTAMALLGSKRETQSDTTDDSLNLPIDMPVSEFIPTTQWRLNAKNVPLQQEKSHQFRNLLMSPY